MPFGRLVVFMSTLYPAAMAIAIGILPVRHTGANAPPPPSTPGACLQPSATSSLALKVSSAFSCKYSSRPDYVILVIVWPIGTDLIVTES